MALRPVRVAFWGVGRAPVLPRGVVADTTDGAGGFLGYVGSSYFSIAADEARLAVGFRFESSGDFETIGTGDEDPVAELKFTCVRTFANGAEEQEKFSASPEVDISSGSWGGSAGERFTKPVLLTEGSYRIDFHGTLSEDYEFDQATFPEVTWHVVVARFRDLFETLPNGKPGMGLQAYTAYDLETGGAGNTDYEFDENEVPLAADISTYPISLSDWVLFLISRVANGMRSGWLPGNYSQLLNEAGWKDSQSIQVSSVYGGGAIDKQQTLQQVVMRVLFEIGGFFDWSGPAFRMIPMPTSSSPALDRTITMDDLVRRSPADPLPHLSIKWTREQECLNVIDPRYLRDYSRSGGDREAYQAAAPREQDTTSLDAIGQQMKADRFWFDWLRREADANATVDAWIRYWSKPKRIVTFRGYLPLLELQRGDIIAFNLTPVITIGGDPAEDDENQNFGDGTFGGGLFGGAETSPAGTIIGETFDGLTSSTRFMIETAVVNWDLKQVEISAREV